MKILYINIKNKNFLLSLTQIFAIFTLLSCNISSNSSQTEYLTFQQTDGIDYPGLIDKVLKQEHFLVYVASNDENTKKLVQNSILTWLEPLHMFNTDINDRIHMMPFNSNLADLKIFVTEYDPNYVPPSSIKCDDEGLLTPNLQACRRSFYSPQRKELYWYKEKETLRNESVILHEIGHAFGIADTYFIDVRDNHPASVMKMQTSRLNVFYIDDNKASLQKDDVMAITYLFCRKNPSRCNANVFAYKNMANFNSFGRNQITYTEAVRKLFVYFENKNPESSEFLNLFYADMEKLKKLQQQTPQHFAGDPVIDTLNKVSNLPKVQLDKFGSCLREFGYFKWKKCFLLANT